MKVVGFTGMPGTGKSEAVVVAKELGFEIFSMGEVVRDEARRRGVPMTDSDVGRFAADEREKHGKAIWAQRTSELIMQHAEAEIVIIDGIRSMDEIELFRDVFGKDFILVAIYANSPERLKRIIKRSREDDVRSMEELEARDDRELGWGVGRAIAKADIMIVNDCSLSEFREKVKEILLRIADAGGFSCRKRA